MKENQTARRFIDPDKETGPDRLAQVVEAVAKDARNQPERYLKETTVPEGGE